MAYTLPDGSKLFLGTSFATAVTVTALSNADPAVATATAHGLADGTPGILTSGWEDADARVFRVDDAATNTFELEGFDSSDTTLFTPGGGVGSFRPITGWQEIQQVLNPSTSGGEQQFATVEPLAKKNAIQIPTSFSPMTLTVPIGDDPSLPGYLALKLASDKRELRPLRIQKPNGATNYFYGYVSLNEVPSLTKGQVDTVTATFALQALPTRYSTAV
jgi:hypothetical protein